MSIVRDMLYGYVVGDAMGLPLKYEKREVLLKNPVSDMTSGSWNDDDGHWSSNTALALATMDSLAEKKRIDFEDMMNKYCSFVEVANYTSNGVSGFELSNTTRKALTNYHNKKIEPRKCGLTEYDSNDNGVLSRMFPVALYCFANKYKEQDIYATVRSVAELTNAHQISIMGCFLYVRFLIFIMHGKDKHSAYNMLKLIDYTEYFRNETISEYGRILDGNIKDLTLKDISSTDNIVDTLETIFWAVLVTENYPQSIIGTINLGGDTTSMASLTGAITGLIYTNINIPGKWINKIKRRDYLDEILFNFDDKIMKHEK